MHVNIYTISDIVNESGSTYQTVARHVRQGSAPQPTGTIGKNYYWDGPSYEAFLEHLATSRPAQILARSNDQIREWLSEGVSQAEIGRQLNVNPSSLGQHIKTQGLKPQVWREPEEREEDRFEAKVATEVKRRLRSILEGLEG